jgi:hypothetical protein
MRNEKKKINKREGKMRGTCNNNKWKNKMEMTKMVCLVLKTYFVVLEF